LNSKIITTKSFLKKKNIKNKKVVLVGGVFDLVHIGHVDYLNEASKLGDILIVALTHNKYVNKGPFRPYFNTSQRAEFLSNLKTVDYIIINNEVSPKRIISSLKPAYYVKGPDYKDQNQDFTKNIIQEKKLIKKFGGLFKTTKGRQFSSSKILNQESDILNKDAKIFLRKINKEKLFSKFLSQLHKIKDSKIVLFGEAILDEFTYVETRGKSQKSNILSTAFRDKETNLGGVLIIACHLSSFFKEIELIIIGKLKKDIKKQLPINIKIKEINIKNFSTIKKNRFVDYYSKTKLFQINENDVFTLSSKDEKKIINQLKVFAKKKFNFALTDFGHGLFNKSIVKFLNAKSIKKFINCQSNSSNYGYNIFTKFNNSKLTCVDEVEFRLATQERLENIKPIIQKNQKSLLKFKNLIITMGKNGCYYLNKKKIYFIPTMFKNQLDTLGAGDAFFSGMIICDYIKSMSVVEKSIIAHIFGGIHSNVYGNENYLKKDKVLTTLRYILK
tara:strand:+ start:2808 stop:4310 length:1503 start_codon:yes stop_codon:yes gene_type:complete